MDTILFTKTNVKKFSPNQRREDCERNRFPSVRMILFVFRTFYAWPEKDMGSADQFRYRLKGIAFCAVFIHLSVAGQIAYTFTAKTRAELFECLFVLLTQMVLMMKLQFFYKNVTKIQKLFYQLDGELYVSQNTEEDAALAHVRQQTTIFWVVYLIFSDGLVGYWASISIMHQVLLLPSYCPFEFESSYWKYLAMLTFQSVSLLMNASFNISCDSLVAALLAMANAHLQRLQMQLMKVGHKNDAPGQQDGLEIVNVKPVQVQTWKNDHLLSVKDNEASHDAVYDDLLKCIRFHQELTGFIQELLDLFGMPIIAQLFCSILILCITEFRLLSDVNTVEDTIHLLAYLMCLLIQVFQYCFYGNEVSYTAKKVHEATAFVNYPDMNIKTRKLLISFQQRTAAGTNCYGKYIFRIELSMATFVKIIKTSYSCLAVLQSTMD